MAKNNTNDKDPKKENEDKNIPQPDPETLGKTDPQENMKGPVSSLVHKVEKKMEENDQEGDDEKK
jgi:hypothetical protein